MTSVAGLRRWRQRVVTAMLGGAFATNCAVPTAVTTPLPVDVRLIVPSNDIPKHVAAFSGTWSGRYTHWVYATGRSGPTAQDIALVVERIRTENGQYLAAVLWSWGDKNERNEPAVRAGYTRLQGAIGSDGALKIGVGNYGTLIFRLLNDTTLHLEHDYGAASVKVYGTLGRSHSTVMTSFRIRSEALTLRGGRRRSAPRPVHRAVGVREVRQDAHGAAEPRRPGRAAGPTRAQRRPGACCRSS